MSDPDKLDMPPLGQSQRDDLALVARAAASFVPMFGGVIGEVITEIVSDRQARLEEYVRLMREMLSTLKKDVERLKELANRNMFEDGARAAVQQTNGERIKNIAVCVANGISENGAADNRQRARLIEVVSQLDEDDIRLLDYYQRTDASITRRPIGSEEHLVSQEFSMARLERLNLLKFQPSMVATELPQAVGHPQREILMPQYGSDGDYAGEWVITRLGTLVLESIAIPDADK